MLNNKKNQSGFTLVEMMIVIGILAILAAIAYPNYMQYVQRARMEAARAEMTDNIRMMEEHYAKNRTVCEISNANGSCKTMPSAVENIAAEHYDTKIIADPMNPDSSNYVITSVPNGKAKYSSATLNNKQLYMLYYSNGSGFTKCTKGGYDKVVKQKNADNSNSDGCSVM